ncbi:hypothetical protein [Actinosynnema pretiosum]|uniref:Uncharacterized protein n=2 Tax=Actinosynnema TaxID=40566 RepID=A0A290ZEK1_9PSEU|nr:hypothetical protein [Actinosynnema pretiosum]ATE57393.1 hypothetical protein CNX65_32200 [Actinosynnema pretiosum]
MSSAADRLAAVKNRMATVLRDHADTRVLREERVKESAAKAADSLVKQGRTAEKVIGRIQEIGRAKRGAAAVKKPDVYSFGPEDDSGVVDEVDREAQEYLRDAEARKAAAEAPKDGSFMLKTGVQAPARSWAQQQGEPPQQQQWGNQPQPWGNQQPQPRGGQQEPPTQPFAQQPPSWQQPAQQPPARGRRAAPPPPDDDDMSGQTWLS